MARAVIHLNVADFAVAVERAADVQLKDRPVIIAPPGAARAVVYDMSDEAFHCGVHKGMALPRALRLCPAARVRPPRRDLYERAMQALLTRALPYSPLVESGPDDGHIFLDVTGSQRLFGPPMDVAWRLRRQVRRELGLDPIWSVAPGKLIAKVATRLVKPSGEYIVAAGEEQRFLAPLPLHLIPGIEAETLARLAEFNLNRVAQVTALDLRALAVILGKYAHVVHTAVRGIDTAQVRPARLRAPVLYEDYTFDEDTNTVAEVEHALYHLAEKTGKVLRQRLLATGRLTLVIDYTDGWRCIRRRRVRSATANDMTLFELSRTVLALAWSRRLRIRHIRLICDRLVFPPAQQLDLFAAARAQDHRRHRLMEAIDIIRRRFGDQAVQMGRRSTIVTSTPMQVPISK